VSRFAKGGVITGPNLPSDMVKVKLSDGHREYWDPQLGRWVPILTSSEVNAIAQEALETLNAPEQELADDYARNDHQ
jgi:hypothetical protein